MTIVRLNGSPGLSVSFEETFLSYVLTESKEKDNLDSFHAIFGWHTVKAVDTWLNAGACITKKETLQKKKIEDIIFELSGDLSFIHVYYIDFICSNMCCDTTTATKKHLEKKIHTNFDNIE